MINTNYIEAKRTDKGLILFLINGHGDEGCGIRAIQEAKEQNPDEFCSDDVMYEFFEGFIANTEWEWIDSGDIGALTSAPILGIRDVMNDEVEEAYGYMDYAIKSIMEDLLEHGYATLIKG